MACIYLRYYCSQYNCMFASVQLQCYLYINKKNIFYINNTLNFGGYIMKNKETVLKLAEKSDSFFLYDESTILADIKKLKNSFPGIEILYSVKSNPHPQVVSTVFSQGLGSDEASLKEVMISKENKLPKEQIFFSAPGKNDLSIKESIDDCILVADSLSEIERINAIAKELGKKVEIGVRINPDFTFTADEGSPSKFGIDEKKLFDQMPAINNMENITVTGMHIHLKSQELQ
ncbi:MAG: hypothetical protein EOM23_11795, partial [Candidatus Moranbacteria bacterium]|nr:hypothetical protein [Candidatus Moranbacteria bacterium]